MSSLSVFDIMGPIMIGPSSSHTAGAARLGKVAKTIADGEVSEVTFYLHGSFAKTYKGHGTDRALVAGILGMEPADKRLRNSLEIAKEEGVSISFVETDLGDAHPNTVKFVIRTKDNKKTEVVGSSIGGGMIEITEVNGNPVEFSGTYETIILTHKDVPGVVSNVSNILYNHGVNIAFMKVFRSKRGCAATMIFEVDNNVDNSTLQDIKNVEAIDKVILIHAVGDE